MTTSAGNQTVTTSNQPDAQTQQYLEQYRQQALQNAQAGNPNLQAAGQGFGQAANNLGFGSQTGLGGVDQYFNPYQQEVVGAVQSDFDRQRTGATNRAADLATQAGAFGGDRSAILEAQMLRDVNQSEAGVLANLRNQGFQTASNQLMNERARMGNLGLSGLQGQAGVGQSQGQLGNQATGLLGGAVQGGGYTQTQNTPLTRNRAAGALGGAATGATIGSAIPGIGTAIGAGVGGLLGLFG